MSDTKAIIPRSKMTPPERELRSQLSQCVHQRGMLRGSLLVRRRVCGKPRCKCASGAKHESLYLVISEGGKSRQLFVPRDWEATVRQWVQDYHRAQEFMEELSQLFWEKVRKRRA